MKVGKTLDLVLADIAHGGEAIGRYNGQFVFVLGGIPGEWVRVEVIQEKARWMRGRLMEVLSPSPDRVVPPCPYFGYAPGCCGGCQWQHVAGDRQRALKGRIVCDQLARLAHLTDVTVQPVLAVGEPYGYLNWVQLMPDEEGRLGFFEQGSDGIVAVDACLLLHPLLAQMFRELQVSLPELACLHLRAGIETGEQMVILETRDNTPPQVEVDLPVSCLFLASSGEAFPLIGDEAIHERVDNHIFRLSGTSPFPSNTAGAAALVEWVASYLVPEPSDTLLDVHCGVGLLGLSLAERVGRVIALEEDPVASDDFRANAAALGNVTLREGVIEETLAQFSDAVDLAVVSLPDEGVGRVTISRLAKLQPRRLVCVFGDAALLAREAKAWQTVGYRLVEVQPLDLFAQTCRVGGVARFERRV